MKKDYIEIILAADDKYAMYCAVTMVSILKNTKSPVRFHIFDGNISPENKNKILEYKAEYDCEIIFYDTNNLVMPNLPLNREWISIATYYRLFILDILPETIKKAIYLDCDIIVEQDIKSLWDYDINNYIAGTIEDDASIPHSKRLKLSDNHCYFNAGVLLLNIDRLRDFNYKEKAFQYFKDNANIIELQDQDILNGIFDGNCLRLPLKFNANATLFSKVYQERNNSSKEEKDIARKTPAIIHYTGADKPWLPFAMHPKANRFYHYAKFTHFPEQKNIFFRRRFLQNFYHYKKYWYYRGFSILNIPVYSNIDEEFSLFSLLQFIFSIKNSPDKSHKVIRILGVSLKFNKKYFKISSTTDFSCTHKIYNVFGLTFKKLQKSINKIERFLKNTKITI